MNWATRRQLEYLTLAFFAVLIFIVLPFFVFIYKAPTCFDGKMNGAETGVDCGGACKLLCPADVAEPVSRTDPRLFKMKDGLYSVVAELDNVNASGEVYSAPYAFKLYDASGTLITERDGKTFIPRGQTFAIFESGIDTGNRIPTRATFAFTGSLTWTRNTDPSPDVEVTHGVLMNASTSPRVQATVTNNSLSRVQNIDLVALVSDASGNTIGASHTYIDSLEAGDSQTVTFTWTTPFPTTSSVCASPADVMIALDRSGSMAAFGANPPEPLTDAKNAADYFVNQLDTKDRVGLVTFATDASITPTSLLTSNLSAIRNSIDATVIGTNGVQETNIADAIMKSYLELSSSRKRVQVPGFIVLLTDGVATVPTLSGHPTFAMDAALSAASTAKSAGLTLFTIGLGKDVDANFLRTIASTPNESYSAPSASDLSAIYADIATTICTEKASVIDVIPRIFPYSLAF